MAAERRRPDWLTWAGAAACVLALVAAALLPASAWRAWLAAAVLWSALPIGAVAWRLIMRLAPGDWLVELGPVMEALGLLLPLGALAFVPVLVELGAIYVWVQEPAFAGFKGLWLSAPFFVVRTLAWFAILGVLALKAARPGGPSAAASSIGLILFASLGGLMAVDWLLSIDPGFASSGFGLYVLCIQLSFAFAMAILALLGSGAPVAKPGVLGAILLSMLLMWAYFAFTHYFITWSGDLPPGVLWYQRRGDGFWGPVIWLTAATRLIPCFLLFFGPIRRSRRGLGLTSLAVAAGTALEAAWLAIPAPAGAPQPQAADAIVFLLAAAGLGLLTAGLYPRALAWRARRVAP